MSSKFNTRDEYKKWKALKAEQTVKFHARNKTLIEPVPMLILLALVLLALGAILNRQEIPVPASSNKIQEPKQKESITKEVAQKSENSSPVQEVSDSTPQYLLDTLVSKTPGVISGSWTGKGSAWLNVPAGWANDQASCREIADLSARFLRSQLGYVVCVHIYYGNLREITSECR